MAEPLRTLSAKLRVRPGARVRLEDRHASRHFDWDEVDAKSVLQDHRKRLEELQYQMYADGRHGLLAVLQAIDAGGKDGTVRNVFTAFNPQGCTVTSFKAPCAEELRHDFLWRVHQRVPPRGEVGVFNRSHYEDVLVVRVDGLAPKAVWSRRYQQINDFERMLAENGIRVVKFFLHVSRDEQKERLEDRVKKQHKQWKFDPDDLRKRSQWTAYRKAFEDAISRCSTTWAPWYVIPADHKWFRDLAVAQVLLDELSALPLAFPKPKFDPDAVKIR